MALEQWSVDVTAINETWIRAGEEARVPAPSGYKLRHIPRTAAVRSPGGRSLLYSSQVIRVYC